MLREKFFRLSYSDKKSTFLIFCYTYLKSKSLFHIFFKFLIKLSKTLFGHIINLYLIDLDKLIMFISSKACYCLLSYIYKFVYFSIRFKNKWPFIIRLLNSFNAFLYICQQLYLVDLSETFKQKEKYINLELVFVCIAFVV